MGERFVPYYAAHYSPFVGGAFGVMLFLCLEYKSLFGLAVGRVYGGVVLVPLFVV